MLLAILTTVIVVAGLGASLRSGRRGGLIAEHGYNNRYNDASAAREDALP